MFIPCSIVYEFRLDPLRDHAGGVAAGQQLADRLAAAWAEIERPVVDVHADELIGLGLIKIAAVLQRVAKRFLAMIEPVLNALLQQAIDVAIIVGSPRSLANRIGAQRQAADRFARATIGPVSTTRAKPRSA